ncbi:Heat shock protein 12A, partial [Araneus ventricosus]
HLSRDTIIYSANGKGVSALTVFAHALRYFRKHALQELSDQSATCILNDDVRWVVTVPAIWRQPAKQFMRNAAYEVTTSPSKQLSVISLYSFWKYISIDLQRNCVCVKFRKSKVETVGNT